MANRIVGNVVIIDTSSGNTAIPIPSNAKISTITFWSIDTTGTVTFTTSNTANAILTLSNPANSPNTVGAYLGRHYFTDILKVPVLTAGTAWVYLV